MSAIKNPVGPQARRVYARRRLFVLLALLAVIAVIVLIIVRPGSGGEVSPTPATSESAQTQAPALDCTAPNVVVAPVVDNPAYAAGAHPKLSLTVTNNGAEPCTINAGTAVMVFTIKSGSETYWTSTDCQKDAVDHFVVLAPGQSAPSEPISWDRTRSATDTCEAARQPVPASGVSYHLSASLGGIGSAETAQFMLH